MIYRYVTFVLRLISRIFFHLETQGLRNTENIRGAILAANHASYLDPIMAGVPVSGQVYYLARKTLFRNKYFGRFLHSVNVVPFNRDVPDIRALNAVINLLKSGRKVLMFPEGTRTLDGNLQHAHAGISLIAVKAKVPIIPVYIKGTFEALPKNRKSLRLGKIKVSYGKPIYLTEWLKKEKIDKSDYQDISGLIMQRIKELRDDPVLL